MSEQAETPGANRWRRRHPVLSRGLLYGACALLVALAVGLLQRRQDTDREDRLDYLSARLDALDVLAVNDDTGDEVSKVLDELFAELDLTADLRQRALRARAFNHLKREAWGEALADLGAARALATDPLVAEAIALERAQVLILAGRADEAESELEALPGTAHVALAAWRDIQRAQVLEGRDRRDDAIRLLDEALVALPRPLAAAEAVVIHQTAWTPAAAALQATHALTDLLGPKRPAAAPWVRLLALAPGDLTAAFFAARALQQGGHEAEALRAWTHAVVLNGGRPPPQGASDPDLRALEELRVDFLKPGTGSGR